MYESYWRLNSKPFESGGDTRLYYPAESHQAALLKLRYAIESQRHAALLAGEPGTGKSLLVRMLAQQLPERYRPVVHFDFPQLPAAELVTALAARLDPAQVPAASSLAEAVERIQRTLADNAAQGRHAVVAIDDAHLLDDGRAFDALRLLMNFEAAARPVLTILFVGQPCLATTIERKTSLDERIASKCLLRPLSLDETAAYVEHRLRAAGATRLIFEADALEALFYLTQGVPRRIHRLADLALLIGFAEERPTVAAAQVEAVAQELLVTVAA
ncbi:MAG: AAA family ATPase [Pirellulales bacterium]